MPVTDQKKYLKSVKANEQSLNKQSRSFAIPILNLDTRFRDAVMVEYNLNKTIDTIEDAANLESSEKIALINDFCEHLKQGVISERVQKRMLETTPKDEIFVFTNYEETLYLYNQLPKPLEELSLHRTIEMANGMCEFLDKTIETIDDLNQYCYYVAGSVGLYLTELLQLQGENISEDIFQKLEKHAVSFGLFLQKLNVIRDFGDDIQVREKHFWPQEILQHAKTPQEAFLALCEQTQLNDIPGAITYCSNIPEGNESFDHFLRFILYSGLEYLKHLKDNVDEFSHKKIKLPKMFIQNLYKKVSKLSREEFLDYCHNSQVELSS